MVCIVVWLQVHLNSLYCHLCGPRLEDNMRRLKRHAESRWRTADGVFCTPVWLQVHVCPVLLCGCEYMIALYFCVAASRLHVGLWFVLRGCKHIYGLYSHVDASESILCSVCHVWFVLLYGCNNTWAFGLYCCAAASTCVYCRGFRYLQHFSRAASRCMGAAMFYLAVFY